MEPNNPMEPFEQEVPEQMDEASRVQRAEEAQENAPQQPQSGYYHGMGVGQRETTFGADPYTSYQPYQSYVPPVQQEAPQKPKKDRQVGKSILKGVGVLILAAVLVVVSCGVTAGLTSLYWKHQYNLMMQNLEDKADALQSQIDALERVPGSSAGTLAPSGETLSAGQIYQKNVNSVVALTCSVTQSSNGQNYTATSAGTGFIITETGFIVTNHHVIEGASAVKVTMADGTEYAAQIIGSDATNDVAVIKVNGIGLTPVTIGSSKNLQVGDQVVAIGNALGELSSSLTVGYISGTDRAVTTDGSIINMLQTDVAINSGNSGGPLFNAKGEVIGITTAKYSGTTSSGASIEGIGFAIPVDDVLEIIEDLRDFGYVKSAYLGIYASDVDPAAAEYYGFPVGVYVANTEPGFCAATAGIQSKDIIVEIGGYKITCMNDLGRALRELKPGTEVTVIVWRGGQNVILSVTLDEKPRN